VRSLRLRSLAAVGIATAIPLAAWAVFPPAHANGYSDAAMVGYAGRLAIAAFIGSWLAAQIAPRLGAAHGLAVLLLPVGTAFA